MAEIFLTSPLGERIFLRTTSPKSSIQKAEQTKELLGQDVVDLTIGRAAPLDLEIGAKLTVFGDEYKLNYVPEATKSSDWDYVYELKLEGVQYDLLSVQFFDCDANGFYKGSEFPLTGEIDVFITVIINNLSRKYGVGVWKKGEVIPTDVKTIEFTNLDCLAALQTVCQEFGTEFEILRDAEGNRTINIKKVGTTLSDVYEYGKNKGGTSLNRKSINPTGPVNKLYPRGSTENLKPGYRDYSPRLKIGSPGYDFVVNQASIDAFGEIEGTKNFDEVKPGREGVITAVNNDANMFFDEGMNFDLFEKDDAGNSKYMVDKKPAIISMNSGNLAGYKFEVSSYTHELKVFTVLPITDKQGLTFPDPAQPVFQFAVGDKYVILDIVMPEQYVSDAEDELRTKGQNYVDANCWPMVNYGLTIDRVYLKKKTSATAIPNYFSLGDLVGVKDAPLKIDKFCRVVKFVRQLLDPFDYKVDLADTYQVSIIQKQLSEKRKLESIIRMNHLNDPIRARQNWKTVEELSNAVFDTDGNFIDGKIKASTIEAIMLTIGTKSQQFILNMVIEPNYQGQKNVVRAGGGTLVHFTIDKEIKTWIFNAQSATLANDQLYYIYARCTRSTTNGTILFSQNQLKFDEDPNVYYFLIGVLHSVDPVTFVRWISLTYGSSSINGRFIKTGRIQSNNSDTYFDLDNGEIGGKIMFRQSNGTMKLVRDLETDIAALKDYVDNLDPGSDGKIETWYIEGVPTLSNYPANQWTTNVLKDEHLNDLCYNTIAGKAYRFIKDGTYKWFLIEDSDLTQALALAQLALDTADKKGQIFLVQPTTPYEKGDLWFVGGEMKVCKVSRLTGSYNALDWDIATYYDNTVTTINGGIVTSGTIQLAGEGGSILAGITGVGTADTSIRIWAGASYANRAVAPFRITQGGEIEARKKIEVFNASNIGMAGICGFNVAGDGPIVAWFGAAYASRNTAPTRIENNGKLITVSALIGKWSIGGDGMVNENGQAYIIGRSSTATKRTEFIIGANVFPATFGGKGAAFFQATEDNTLADNYAIVGKAANATLGNNSFSFYGQEGIVYTNEFLHNGDKTRVYPIPSGAAENLVFDPSQFNFLVVQPATTGKGISFGTTFKYPIKDGAEVSILNQNGGISIRIYDTIINQSSFLLNGGALITLKWFDGSWYTKSFIDN